MRPDDGQEDGDAKREAVTIPPRVAKRKRRFRLALEILAAALVLFGIRAYQLRGVRSGTPPVAAISALDGSVVTLAGTRDKPLIVHFWASWCGVCGAMRSNLIDVAHDSDVVAVATQSGTVAEVAQHAKEHGLTMPVVHDPNGTLARQHGVRAFPTTFFIDRKGEIRHVEVGYVTKAGLRLRHFSAGL